MNFKEQYKNIKSFSKLNAIENRFNNFIESFLNISFSLNESLDTQDIKIEELKQDLNKLLADKDVLKSNGESIFAKDPARMIRLFNLIVKHRTAQLNRINDKLRTDDEIKGWFPYRETNSKNRMELQNIYNEVINILTDFRKWILSKNKEIEEINGESMLKNKKPQLESSITVPVIDSIKITRPINNPKL